MRTLLAFELKKILNRKTLWLALALGVVMWVQVRGTGYIYERLSGRAQGFKDVTMQYEGQVLTEALQARIQADFDGYVAAHADRFAWKTFSQGEPEEFTSLCTTEEALDYDDGVLDSFGSLTVARSLEERQERMRQNQQALASGEDEQGKPLTAKQRRAINEEILYLAVTPVVHYARGWQEFFQSPNENGLWVLVAVVMALLGLFNGEASARMEPIVLTARSRRRAVAAKLLAAAMVAGGSVALFFGLQFAAMAYTWGLQGALLPATALDHVAVSMPIIVVFALTVLVLALAAMACAAVVAWASARFRHGLLSLLASGAILAGMAILWRNSWMLMEPPYNLHGNTVYEVIREWLLALPINTLMDPIYMSDRVTDWGTLAQLVLLPMVLSALLCWLAVRAFLRRRKI